ncbi:MAG TPA: endonuclease domain-containing protein [Longimicrobium sp.]
MPDALRVRMRDVAREHRKHPTSSESLLWECLRGTKLDGRKFRRQQPIGPFIVDFYCPEERLVVEVDGKIHERQQREDADRQEALESLGLRFVRVTHEEVILDLQSALAKIRAAFAVSTPLPHPSPLVGEGPGVGGIRAAAAPGLVPRADAEEVSR